MKRCFFYGGERDCTNGQALRDPGKPDHKELVTRSTVKAGINPILTSSTTSRMQRPKVDGKFLVVGAEKFFVKGVTYGSFPPNTIGDQFPEADEVATDFALMRREGGINTILTYTVPPITLLDQAEEFGLESSSLCPGWNMSASSRKKQSASR